MDEFGIIDTINFGLRLLWTQALLRRADERISELEMENAELRAGDAKEGEKQRWLTKSMKRAIQYFRN